MSDAGDGVAIGDAPADASREYGPVVLVLACAVAVVLAAALVPFVSSTGDSSSPAESLVPVPANADQPGGGDGSSGGQSGFGALNVGEESQIGGDLSSDDNAFRSQDTRIHFTVRSQESSYWRTGAFDTYTGDSWSQSGRSDATAPLDGEQVRYRVELERSASSAPVVWRPTALDDAEDLELTAGGRALATGRLDAGTSYVGVSRKPPRDPSVLRASGRDYPDDIEERYTQLPGETRQSLGPFTDDLTADANSPYETAVAIENWLEAEKEYSLNVSNPQGDDVASKFVFEMDKGYCQYFATAMVAMLRTQDVPARYVVGYSTGQQVGPDTYKVRAMNAHAWVEVYFADVGWVRFDPTPGSERLQQERQSFQENDEPGSYSVEEEGSPNETLTPDSGDTPTDDPDGDPSTPSSPTTPRQPPEETPSENDTYTIALNRTAVPGATVEISVFAGAQSVVGALVSVDGEVVGVTDRDGTVVTTVPYESAFDVTVSGSRSAGANVTGAGVSSVERDPAAASDPSGSTVAPDNETRTFDVETNATLSLAGDPRTGETVVVTATVADVPVRGGNVTLDGERVGRTDANGRAEVTLPATPGNVTLGVEHGPVAGTRTVRLSAVNVSVDPVWPVPVAGTGIEVTASVGGEPVTDVPVRVGEELVGETGVNGTVTATLPFESTIPVVVTSGEQTARTTVSNPLVNAVGVLVAVLGIVIAGWALLTRRGIALRDVPERLATLLRRGSRAIVRAFVEAMRAIESAVDAGIDRLKRTLAHLRSLVAGDRTVEELLAALRAWVAGHARRLRGARPFSNRSTRQSPGAGGTDATNGPTGARLTIRDAWGRFLRSVSVRETGTKTPGQIAAHAVSTDDLPPEAVATLRDEFRAVEYGPRSPDEAVPAVSTAIEAIESAVADGRDTETENADGRGIGSSASTGGSE